MGTTLAAHHQRFVGDIRKVDLEHNPVHLTADRFRRTFHANLVVVIGTRQREATDFTHGVVRVPQCQAAVELDDREQELGRHPERFLSHDDVARIIDNTETRPDRRCDGEDELAVERREGVANGITRNTLRAYGTPGIIADVPWFAVQNDMTRSARQGSTIRLRGDGNLPIHIVLVANKRDRRFRDLRHQIRPRLTGLLLFVPAILEPFPDLVDVKPDSSSQIDSRLSAGVRILCKGFLENAMLKWGQIMPFALADCRGDSGSGLVKRDRARTTCVASVRVGPVVRQ